MEQEVTNIPLFEGELKLIEEARAHPALKGKIVSEGFTLDSFTEWADFDRVWSNKKEDLQVMIM